MIQMGKNTVNIRQIYQYITLFGQLKVDVAKAILVRHDSHPKDI